MEGYCLSRTLKAQLSLRLLCMALLVSTACTVRLDAQRKLFLGVFDKKATSKDLPTLQALVIVASVAAGYHLLQLSVSLIRVQFENPCGFNKFLAWCSFLLDQLVAYVSFATTLAAAQLSLLAITGASEFQWMKLCNIYTRFCFQVGGGIACGLIASLSMAVISSISAFNLFREYSRTNFLLLKPK